MEGNTRGGRRPGAGRPKGDSRRFSFRAPGEMARRIEAEPHKSEFITNCINLALRQSKREPDLSWL